MLEPTQIEHLNRGYVCPSDAGPEWRAACEEGIDMSLVELNLEKTPWQRMCDHDSALEMAFMLKHGVLRLHASA